MEGAAPVSCSGFVLLHLSVYALRRRPLILPLFRSIGIGRRKIGYSIHRLVSLTDHRLLVLQPGLAAAMSTTISALAQSEERVRAPASFRFLAFLSALPLRLTPVPADVGYTDQTGMLQGIRL